MSNVAKGAYLALWIPLWLLGAALGLLVGALYEGFLLGMKCARGWQLVRTNEEATQ